MKNNTQLLKNFSIPLISDALDMLGINGGLEGIVPLIPGKRIVGPAYTLEFEEVNEGQIGPAADFIDEVEEGQVIVIANKARSFCTVWGGILTYVAKKRGISGCIIDGACRDIDEIRAADFPMFCRSTYMKSGKNRVHLVKMQKPIVIANTIIRPSDILCADDSGALCVPYEYLEKTVVLATEIKNMEEKIMHDLEQSISLKEARRKNDYNKFAIQR